MEGKVGQGGGWERELVDQGRVERKGEGLGGNQNCSRTFLFNYFVDQERWVAAVDRPSKKK